MMQIYFREKNSSLLGGGEEWKIMFVQPRGCTGISSTIQS